MEGYMRWAARCCSLLAVCAFVLGVVAFAPGVARADVIAAKARTVTTSDCKAAFAPGKGQADINDPNLTVAQRRACCVATGNCNYSDGGNATCWSDIVNNAPAVPPGGNNWSCTSGCPK